MPRKRIIDPDFWIDEIVGKWDFKTMLVYIGLWTLADSNGILEDNTERTQKQLFPYKKTKIDKSMQILKESDKVCPYRAQGKNYLLIKNFKKWQKETHPSFKYPTPNSFKKERLPWLENWKPPV